MVYIIFTQLQIYEEDFKREKREKESLQQQLRAKNSGVSHMISAIRLHILNSVSLCTLHMARCTLIFSALCLVASAKNYWSVDNKPIDDTCTCNIIPWRFMYQFFSSDKTLSESNEI